ncbi:MAG TPA: tRNA (adenosine(37)-N6)-dimethylallyltransferase MiaA [Chthoniobacterales bacterium]|nr:tRNA (adenosine(37)-N6)-dimethylallyltransferase MiaA [Chthoniobacterales bacterium]
MAVFPSLLVILGPTASGKSDLAMELARRVGGEILSVDSMQVYRGMNVGTAKPTQQDLAAVRHHLIDLVEPNESFTVARFVEMAEAVIADAKSRGVPLIATGGTPLYYKALFEGIFEGPSADPQTRRRLAELPNDQLAARLAAVDPAAASRIHANDTKRLIRALEVFELTGRPITSFQTDWSNANQRHAATWIGLEWEKETLNRRINARVKAMFAGGWVEETCALLDRFGTLSPTAGEATGYRQIIEHLAGKLSLEEAIEQIKIATRQLARRQMKWFRRFPNVRWLAGDRAADEISAEVFSLLSPSS